MVTGSTATCQTGVGETVMAQLVGRRFEEISSAKLFSQGQRVINMNPMIIYRSKKKKQIICQVTLSMRLHLILSPGSILFTILPIVE